MRHFVNNICVIANTLLLVLGLVVAPHAGATTKASIPGQTPMMTAGGTHGAAASGSAIQASVRLHPGLSRQNFLCR